MDLLKETSHRIVSKDRNDMKCLFNILNRLVFSFLVLSFSQNSFSGREFLGEVSFEGRYFSKEGFFDQDKFHSSISFSPEIYIESEDSKKSFTFKSKFRKDSEDSERDIIDIQELNWTIVGNIFETKIGIRKDFWGVTETVHRVDIINQTDLVENIDGEDKLGQPMINISFEGLHGTFDAYALLGFRERTFGGQNARLRAPILVNTENPLYESNSEEKRIDFAFRWNQYFSAFEYAVSHFSGTSREPLFEIDLSKQVPLLRPLYNVIDQTGIEILYILGNMAFKLEGFSRSGQEDRFSAATAGVEYTQIGIFESRIDLGWIAEFNHDDRIENSPISVGTRLTFNDIADTQILSGLLWNQDTNEKNIFIEASSRLKSCCKISIEGVIFTKGKKLNTFNPYREPQGLFDYFQDEDFLKLEFIYYL
ncbi:MAG: hypothetical protein P8J93_07885 [SAR86 cluster bacterium]|jgi:hypothetical protein|nr:hypothetical protein [SAR86 cluster bacterium]